MMVSAECKSLEDILASMGEVAVAVSGGVDSITLATVTQNCLGARSTMFHAISPAVPPEATARVRALAKGQGWRLTVFDAGEFADEVYRANPVNRCFYCKGHLYSAVKGQTKGQIISGTNTDDLGDVRPGLIAAKDNGVRHPFVEAGLNKAAVRALARELGLGALSELPAAPCLSSRVETGIAIKAETLRAIHAVENLVTAALRPLTVRCRVRQTGIVVELDRGSLDKLNQDHQRSLRQKVEALFAGPSAETSPVPVTFAEYRTGSAFLWGSQHGG